MKIGGGIIDYKKINIGMLGIKIINLCYLVIFGAISLVLLFRYQKENILFWPLWILISGLIVFAGWKLSDKAGNINTRRRMEIVLFGIIVLLTLMAVWQLRMNSGADWWSVYNGAVEWATYHEFKTTWFLVYFNQYQNNIPWVLLTALLYRGLAVLHITRFYEASIILNVFLFLGSILLLYRTAKTFMKPRIALLFLFFCTFYIPFYLNVPVFYTDIPALFCLAVALFFLSREHQTGDWRWLIGTGAFLGFGFKIKGTVIVALVAVVIWKLLKGQCKGMIAALVGATVCVMCIGFWVQGCGIIQKEYEESRKLPYTHWIMMGLKDDGIYNGDDVKFSLQGRTYEEKKEITKNEIKKRLNEYGVGGLLKHLYKKSIDGVWSGADQNSMIFFYAEPLHEGLASDLFYWKGKYSNTVLLLMKCVYLFYLSLGVLGTGMSWRRGDKNIISLFRLNLLGIFSFLLIWEASQRYVFLFVPFVLFLAAEELENIYVYLRKR